jgi:hypothetical protein
MSTLFQNKQWAVTDFGIERVPDEESPFEYLLPREQLLKQDRDRLRFYDWPIHMAEKTGVDIEWFLEAFTKALEFHKSKSEVVRTMLDASITEARAVNQSVQQRRSQAHARHGLKPGSDVASSLDG